MVVEQDVSVRFQFVSMLFWGAGSGLGGAVIVVWYILFHRFLEHLCFQGALSHFLVLRIKAHKTIRVSHALCGPGSSGKEGLKKVLLAYYFIELSCCYIQ